MSADITLICELAAFAIAAVLAVYAILKLDVRPLLAGGVLAASAWVLAGCVTEAQQPFERLTVLTLRLRPVDVVTGERVSGVTVDVIAPDDSGKAVRWRLPATPEGADNVVLTVSLFIQQEIRGSLWEQYWHPAACTRVGDQQIEIRAPGYQPWRGTLKQLLPEAADEPPTVIKLLRAP